MPHSTSLRAAPPGSAGSLVAERPFRPSTPEGHGATAFDTLLDRGTSAEIGRPGPSPQGECGREAGEPAKEEMRRPLPSGTLSIDDPVLLAERSSGPPKPAGQEAIASNGEVGLPQPATAFAPPAIALIETQAGEQKEGSSSASPGGGGSAGSVDVSSPSRDKEAGDPSADAAAPRGAAAVGEEAAVTGMQASLLAVPISGSSPGQNVSSARQEVPGIPEDAQPVPVGAETAFQQPGDAAAGDLQGGGLQGRKNGREATAELTTSPAPDPEAPKPPMSVAVREGDRAASSHETSMRSPGDGHRSGASVMPQPSAAGKEAGPAERALSLPARPSSGAPPATATVSDAIAAGLAPFPTTGAESSSPSGPSGAAPPDTGRLVPIAGLAVEIAARLSEGKRRFEVRLDPPELGRIDVRLDIGRDGQVTSRLIVERAETLDLLRRDAPTLQQALQSAGLRADGGGLHFSLRDHNPQAQQFTSVPAPKLLIVPDADVAVHEAVRRGYGVLRGLGGGIDIRV